MAVRRSVSGTAKPERERVVIGKGDVDLKGVFSVLKNAGYDGWVSLEALTGGKEDLRFSVEHVRNAWDSA